MNNSINCNCSSPHVITKVDLRDITFGTHEDEKCAKKLVAKPEGEKSH